LNLEILDGEKLEMPDFEKAVSTPAFLAKKRLVIVENALGKNKGQKIQKEILEILAQAKLDDTILVFWEGNLDAGRAKKGKAKTPGKRGQNLFAYLAKEKFAQEFRLLDEAAIYQWAGAEIKKRGGQIASAALKLLTDLVGNDLWQLSGEIDKLIAFARGAEITPERISALVKIKLDEDTFRLTDALAAKNRKLALKLVNDRLKSGTPALELLGTIIWQFRNLLLVKSFMENNGAAYPASRLTYQLGLHPFVIKKTMGLAAAHQLAGLKQIYRRLLQIDYKIKTSQINPEVLFDLLIVKN